MDNIPLLNGINGDKRASLLLFLQPKIVSYRNGEVVSTSKNQIGFILSGDAKITRSDEDGQYCIAEILGEGDMFGSVYSMFLNESTYVVVAGKKCRICIINYNNIISCQNITLVNNFIQCTAKRSRLQGERINMLTQRTIRKKLIAYFDFLSRERRRTTFNVPMTYSNLADYLCVDRSAMMREMKNMEEEKIILINGKTITLVNI